jgi:hypothetical protein
LASIAPSRPTSPRSRSDSRKRSPGGKAKAGAYRKAYNTKASPGHQSRKGQELAKREAIGRQVEAFQAAFEAQRYATPVHLRAMTIHQLTKNALNEDFPPAQRVKCLELLGKITEVALFTERREVVTVSNPAEIKERLIASLRLAMGDEVIDVAATDGMIYWQNWKDPTRRRVKI